MTDKGNILIVDDDQTSLRMLHAVLSSEGYQVRCADSGQQALAAVDCLMPELILLDIKMPDMDGFAVLGQLKELQESRDIAVIFLSGLAEMEKRIEGFKLGAVDFISKPFQPEELLARVRTHLDLHRLRSGFKHQAADLQLANELLLKEIYDRKKAEDELRQSNVFIDALLHAIPVPVFYKDLDGRYLGCNRAFEEFHGCSRRDIIGKSVFDTAHDELAQVDHVKDFELLRHAGLQVYESQVKDARGMVHDVVFHKASFTDPDGRVGGLIGVLIDITGRKKAEQALRESEHSLQSTLDGLSAHIAELDDRGTILLVNKAWREFARQNGLTASAAFEGANYLKVCDEAVGEYSLEAAPFAEGIRAVLSGQADAYALEYPCHSSDKKRWFIGRVTLFPGDGPRRVVVAHEDITGRRLNEDALKLELAERRRVEAVLREAEGLLTEVQKIAHLGTWIYNPETGEFRWSDEVYRIFGLPAGSSMSQADLMQYVHPEDYQGLVEAWINMRNDSSSVDFEYRIIRPDGEIRYIHDYSIYKSNDTGPVLSAAGIMLDITGRKLPELALRAKNAELERYTYTVSHDLRSPLVTIMTFMNHLVEDMASSNTANIAQDVQYINTASAKMNQLLEELLHLSRIGRMVNPSVETPLQEIVQEAMALVAGRIDQRGVRVQVTQEPVMLYGDRVRLVEVFQNLVDNAVKFMGKQSDPLVDIGAEIKNGEIVLFVRDNGMGIDPQHKDKLFELFKKLHHEIEGTGLGLALVKRIVELYGGRIWAESEGLGKGACFWFNLPGEKIQDSGFMIQDSKLKS